MTSDDTARRGLVDLAVLGHYRLVSLAQTEAFAGDVTGGRPALAALCTRAHDDDGLCLLTVSDGRLSDNLADLAWAATRHDAEEHDGDGPYRRWEVGADLDRLYDHSHTLVRGVEQLAGALGVGWTTAAAGEVLRLAVHRLRMISATREVIRVTLPSLTTPTATAIVYALDELATSVPPPAEKPFPRCEAVCPRDQAEKIAEDAGIDRVTGDWRCYLAPHTVTGGRHTVLPRRGGHLYPFTITNGDH